MSRISGHQCYAGDVAPEELDKLLLPDDSHREVAVNNSPPASDHDGPARRDAAARWQLLHGELDQQLTTFRGRRRRDKRKAFALQMATVTLSAIITVLLGL